MLEITMKTNGSITFEEGCNLYLQNCKERNLRDDTIRHYRQSYLRFYKHFDRDMPLSEMNERKYKEYVLSQVMDTCANGKANHEINRKLVSKTNKR